MRFLKLGYIQIPARGSSPKTVSPNGQGMTLLQRGAEYRENKLTATEYDETTWSARTWMTFVMQRLSVAIQRSATFEISRALGFSMATDPRVD